jgi:hypothetical protein
MANMAQIIAADAERNRRYSRPEAEATRGWVDSILHEMNEITLDRLNKLDSKTSMIDTEAIEMKDKYDEIGDKYDETEDKYERLNVEFKNFRLAMSKQVAILKKENIELLIVMEAWQQRQKNRIDSSSSSESESGITGSTADIWEQPITTMRQNALGRSRRKKYNCHKKKSHKKKKSM